VGIVAAGNVPLVALHDVLCVLACGYVAQIKLSATDTVLMQKIFELMPEMLQKNIKVTERLQNFDAVIATGSNNTSRYFEYYFGKVPHIIRKSRTSVAVLSGNETDDDLNNLGHDIFRYFGLGCRNVTKLYVPLGYNFSPFLGCLEKHHSTVAHHHKYFNNYEYNLAIALLNQTPHMGNLFIILIENPQLASAVGVLHYEYYADAQDLEDKILQNHQQLQCVVGDEKLFGAAMPLGTAQQPDLHTYADNIDTMAFLLGL
jgi:hypothetical protein